MRPYFFGVALFGSYIGNALHAQESLVVDRSARDQMNSSGFADVVLILKDQPLPHIAQKRNLAAKLHEELAQGELKASRTLWQPSGSDSARRRLDTLTLEGRRIVSREAQAAIANSQGQAIALLTSIEAENVRQYWLVNMLGARISASGLQAIASSPLVSRIALQEIHTTKLARSVPVTGAPAMWAAGFRGEGESVAVLDSGIVSEHHAFLNVPMERKVFLKAGRLADACFADDENSTEDINGHGTHVAGTIAGRPHDGFEAASGVAPNLGTLVVAKVSYQNCQGTGTFHALDVAEGLEWLAA